MPGSVATTATISIQIGLNLNAATIRGKVSETARSQDQYSAHAISSGGTNAISNAIGYAMHRSPSHDAVIRVYDVAGNAIETHESHRRWRLKFFGNFASLFP